MPTSDKQLAANRANAQNSTGPRTPEGKSRAARNARKHAFAGAYFAIVKLEDREAVDHLRADLITVFQPANSQELFALERIAIAQHTLLRIARLEAGLGTTALNETFETFTRTPFEPLHEDLQVDPQDVREQNRAYRLAHGFRTMTRETPTTWTLFLRYQAQAERHYRRAVEDFERLQKLRPTLLIDDSPNEPISTPQPQEDAPSSASETEPISGVVGQALGLRRPPRPPAQPRASARGCDVMPRHQTRSREYSKPAHVNWECPLSPKPHL
ncbi:MAG: hypothetical protein ABIR70_07055 [Bryobacteraceae bacterium]